jgi:cysteine desulfurase
MPSEVIEGALRIGIGKFTTDIEIEQAAEILTIAIQSIRDLMR